MSAAESRNSNPRLAVRTSIVFWYHSIECVIPRAFVPTYITLCFPTNTGTRISYHLLITTFEFMLYFMFGIQTRFSYHGFITTKSRTEPDFLTTVHYNGKATFQFLLCFPYEGETRFPYHSFITKTFQNNVRNHKILPLFPYKVTRNCYARQYLNHKFPLNTKVGTAEHGTKTIGKPLSKMKLTMYK